ncbi:hypothetical protein IFM89_021613 [Coptis chinensis]|uniref:CAAX prenyl protease 2/Lysostaphin resistance protein A-like domain-containing protein n=1 Tax=Coptis chinensis TaxID=261450 RepID=A0A835IEP3_9MAGN|nr:hypothetical protein IFM89_021613 [Coptis chinensis]
MANPCCHCLTTPLPSLVLPQFSKFKVLKQNNRIFTSLSNFRTLRVTEADSTSLYKKRKVCCFRHEEFASRGSESELVEDKLLEDLVEPELEELSVIKKDFVTTFQEVILLWIASFWFVGSWIVPFLTHAAGFSKDSLTYRGQALYSLLTDVAEGLAGIAILHRCLYRFRPLPSDWFQFSLRGKWQLDVGLGCLMFPLVNRLSQVNLNLVPHLQSSPISVSSVEQSIVARDPVAMALYAVVVAVCAPMWEEIVFRGFLLPSLTKYMPVWCSILVSSVVFALAHFNAQRMLPLIFLGMVMGAVFTRSRNLFAPMLLHSLWNAFVFLNLMK